MKGEEEEDDVEIIVALKKRTTFKSKAAPKNKIVKVKVMVMQLVGGLI